MKIHFQCIAFLVLIFAIRSNAQVPIITLNGPNARVSSNFQNSAQVVNMTGLPRNWAWKDMVVQWNTYGNVPLDIQIKCGNIVRRYKGWSVQIAIPDPKKNSFALAFRNMGGANSFDVTWWASPNTEKSSMPTSGTGIPKRSVLVGEEGVPVNVKSASTKIMLFGRPSRPHNVLRVHFAGKNGAQLTGSVAIGGRIVLLHGTEQDVEIAPNAAKTVRLVFNSKNVQDMDVSWFAVDRTPRTLAIPKRDSVIPNGIVGKYDFPSLGVNLKKLEIKYNSGVFASGGAPTITYLDVLPSNVVADTAGAIAQSWDIHGTLAAGKTATVALPVPENIRNLPNSMAIEHMKIRHYLTASKTWETVQIDSIRDGYAYFVASSFSMFDVISDAWDGTTDAVSTGWEKTKDVAGDVASATKDAAAATWDGITTAGDVIVDYGGDFLGSAAAVIGDIKDGLVGAYKIVRDGYCDYIQGPISDFAVSSITSFSMPAAVYQSAMDNTYASVQLGAPQPRLKADLLNFFPHGQGSLRDEPYVSSVTIDAIQSQLNQNNLKIVPLDGTELERIDIATSNIQAFIDDAMLASFKTGYTPRFTFNGESVTDSKSDPSTPGDPARTYTMSDLIVTSFPWASLVGRIGSMIRSCESSISVTSPIYKTGGHIKDFFTKTLRGNGAGACREMFGIPEDIISEFTGNDLADCISSAKHMNDWMKTQNWKSDKDRVYLGAVEYLTRMNLFLWMNDVARYQQAPNMTAFVSQFADYHDFVRIMLEGNNIAIKGELALGFFELLMGSGDPTRFRKASEFIADRLGPEGGYAEGTGYLEYVNQTLFPLLNVAIKEGWVTPSVLPQAYLKAGDWELSLIQANGYLVPVDDAVNQIPFTAGYAGLYEGRESNLGRFLAPSRKPMNSLELLSMPATLLAGDPNPGKDKVSMKDGAGVVSGKSPDNVNWSMSILAEDSKMLVMGHGHDQQDNGSVSLTMQSPPGVTSYRSVVTDPGYGGYANRLATSGYNMHNNIRLEGVDNLVMGNRHRGFRQASELLDELGAGMGHSTWIAAGNLAYDFAWIFNADVTSLLGQDYGGGAAVAEYVFDASPVFSKLRGISIHQYLDYGFVNSAARRGVIFAGGHFVVVDRARSGKPYPHFNFQTSQTPNALLYEAYGAAGENWYRQIDSTPVSYAQNTSLDPTVLNLGRLEFHGNQPANGSVITFMPTMSGVSGRPCPSSSSGYSACVEFEGDGGRWTVLSNDFYATKSMTYKDPFFGLVRSNAEIMVRQFDPATGTTRYWTMGRAPTMIGTKQVSASAGLEISRDGTLWMNGEGGLQKVGKIPHPLNLELIRKMVTE